MIRGGLASFVVLAVFFSLTGSALADTLSLIFEPGPFTLAKDSLGFDRIHLKGYRPAGSPGEPDLPARVFNVLIPPDTLPDSLSLEIGEAASRVLPGTYNIPAALPDAALRDGRLVLDWGTAHPDLSQGRNMNVYGKDAFFPLQPVRLLPSAQMRKWKYVGVSFFPFQYDPVTRQLKANTSVRVVISFRRASLAPASTTLSDTAFDHLAPKLFHNYLAERPEYTAPKEMDQSGPSHDFVIITTNAIVVGSDSLTDFAAHKQSRGHSVRIVTEDDFGPLTGKTPNHRADKIRRWLINNYLTSGIVYVLLIGDPTPSSPGVAEGDIPMKLCWPRRGEGSEEEAPTDAFYADLTGNWDLDGDGYYGEWSDYAGAGGVDLVPEVWVGRIPVYGADYATLDAILQKIMGYETAGEDPQGTAWRRNVLLPMSFSTTDYDGAPLAEQMKEDFLGPRGYTLWRQYQQGNGACALSSTYTGEEELRGGNVLQQRWEGSPFGIVCWWGHGSATSAMVGCQGCWDGLLLSNAQTAGLDDAHPAFSFQCSCLNGYPEENDNLQYVLLKRGAVATVSATRVSWFNTGVGYGAFAGSSTNAGIGYEYVNRLTQGLSAGRALFEAKLAVLADVGSRSSRLMNQFDFNLYGDPTLSTGQCQTNVDCDDGDWCNGAESCAAGFCRAGPPVVCDDENPCTLDTCDETEDRCSHTCAASGPADPCCGEPACSGSATCTAGCTDLDRDGYGNPASAQCVHPERDCNDLNPTVNPGMAEIEGNGLDDDCNPNTPSWGTRASIGGAAREFPSNLAGSLLAFLAPLAAVLSWRFVARRHRIRRP